VYEMGPEVTGAPWNCSLYCIWALIFSDCSVKVKLSKSALKFESLAFCIGVCYCDWVIVGAVVPRC